MLSHQICKRLRWRVELRYVGAERSEEMYLLTSDPFVMCHRVKDGEEGDLSQSFGNRIYWSDVTFGNPDVICEIRTSRILTDPSVVISCLRPSGLMGEVFCLVLGWQTQLSSLDDY